MRAEEGNGLVADPLAGPEPDLIRAAPPHFSPDVGTQLGVGFGAQRRVLPRHQCRQILDNPRQFHVRITGIGISRLLCRAHLCLASPCVDPRRCGLIKEEGAPEQSLDRLIDTAPECVDDPLQPPNSRRPAFYRIKAVVDGLLTRDIGYRAKDCPDKAGQLCLARFGQTHRAKARLWINIDKAAIHLAPGRAVAQRLYRRFERRVREDGAVDHHRILWSLPSRQNAREERIAAWPSALSSGQNAVYFSDRKGRERTRETGRRARRKGEFGGVGKAGVRSVLAKRECQPMLIFRAIDR